MNRRGKVALIGIAMSISFLASCATTSKSVGVFPLDAETPESQTGFAYVSVPAEIQTLSIDDEKVAFGNDSFRIGPGEHTLYLQYHRLSTSVSSTSSITTLTQSGIVPLEFRFISEKTYHLFSVIDGKEDKVFFHCREDAPVYKSMKKGKVVMDELPREIELSYDAVPLDKEYEVLGSVHFVLCRMTIFNDKPTHEELIYCLKQKAIEYGADALYDTYFATERSFSEPGSGKAQVIDAVLIKYK